jgi:hypothetical protein
MTTPDNAALRERVTEALTGAHNADRRLSLDEALELGFPRRQAEDLCRKSGRIQSVDDVADLAERVTGELAESIAARNVTDPADLARNIPRY